MLVSMNSYVNSICGAIAPNIGSKAEAIAFAVQMSTYWNDKENKNELDMKKAQHIYDFFVTNVNLPDVRKEYKEEMLNTITPLLGILTSSIEKKAPPETA